MPQKLVDRHLDARRRNCDALQSSSRRWMSIRASGSSSTTNTFTPAS
jgi:hypothetical protein